MYNFNSCKAIRILLLKLETYQKYRIDQRSNGVHILVSILREYSLIGSTIVKSVDGHLSYFLVDNGSSLSFVPESFGIMYPLSSLQAKAANGLDIDLVTRHHQYLTRRHHLRTASSTDLNLVTLDPTTS
ncbi:hypothetical protein BLOT_007850 [Blomia tropicalis]|nr:hypothetical protein BLOT_007850 [Blomia tropicalis]